MKITEAEEIVRAELGDSYSVVKLGRLWMVWVKDQGNIRGEGATLAKAIERLKAVL